MKFDVIIGNPPYQISTGGHGAHAKPVYHTFIDAAKNLNPRFLVMITPSRWFAGGMGLNKFREESISDKRYRKIVDFHQSEECFPGVEIKGGVNYFLWDKEHNGRCEFISVDSGVFEAPVSRDLGEFDVILRHNISVGILKKVLSSNQEYMNDTVSGMQPFGLPTNFKEYRSTSKKDSIKLYLRNGIGYISREQVRQRENWIDTHKVLISEAYNGGDRFPHQIIGKPIYASPPSCCTMTYIVCGCLSTETEAKNLMKYLSTKFVRFLVYLRKNTQHINGDRFRFVPRIDFNETVTDNMLYKKHGLTEKEIDFIESMIKPMEV